MSRIVAIAVLVALAYGCTGTTPPAVPLPEMMNGVASWYGEEFAGRTTANGEIFDPLLLTAAHRTLPFGTILDVTNPATKQSVRVRVNDRGPYIGKRVIDLSYAAAQKIGLIEPGIGFVEIAVVKMGSGEREPPAPMEVTIAEAPKTVNPAPPAASPAPEPAPVTEQVPVVVDRVTVEEQRGGTVTRKQVGPDGRTIESVPVSGVDAAPSAATYDAQPKPAPRVAAKKGEFIVQVGAFSVEANAKSLQQKLNSIGQRAWIDRNDLYRVRIGPFATREQALAARTALEAQGMSAIIVAE
ncbi:MAG TPA: septal ring lytic transglycosylase RlpA family protein [Thermoanaerobaculia bacterium]|nr:septal ring lytic transglycosylase RlpA family protein [Thermoanaerobaculia bacterium]